MQNQSDSFQTHEKCRQKPDPSATDCFTKTKVAETYETVLKGQCRSL